MSAGDVKEVVNSSILKRLRNGTPLHRTITLGNGDNSVPIAIVLLNLDKTLSIEEDTEEFCQLNKGKVNNVVKMQYYNRLLASECVRNPNNLEERLATPDEIAMNMDLEDISRVCDAYGDLVMDKQASKIESLSQEEFEDLKKYLEVTQLKDLSTVLQIHLRSCHQTVVSSR